MIVPETMGSRLIVAIESSQRAAHEVRWPSPRWRNDPAKFAEEVLGVELWSKQKEIARAILPLQAQVAVASGHKIGKSLLVATLALWFYCSFPDARVMLMSRTGHQVDDILWHEVRRLWTRAKIAIGGDMHEIARSGLRSGDFREIKGLTASDPEAAAGISGGNMLFILDEASGIPDEIWEAMTGNTAGGVRVVLLSNPTKSEGFFFRAFHADKAEWTTFQVSSENTPNVLLGREVVPGLATLEWVQRMKRVHGEESGVYRVRVKGEFVLGEDSKICSYAAISAAAGRYETVSGAGPLRIGLDPAGEGGRGDDSAFVVRRGDKVLEIFAAKGLSVEAHLAQIDALLRKYRDPQEKDTIVIYDREGPTGYALVGPIREHAAWNGYSAIGVRSSDNATRLPREYSKVRDELWENVRRWLRTGGIPADARLQNELHAPEWSLLEGGKLKATSKEKLRKDLGGSPDVADALCLAVWEPARWEPLKRKLGDPPDPSDQGRAAQAPPEPAMTFDPYAGVDAWQRRR